jgi:HAD superfamily hydrolase (TIGR01484 family)
MMKQLIAFDLDGTLARSKQAIDAEMGTLLARLTEVAQVAVISGGNWPQFEAQLVANLPEGAALGRLWLLPTSGTKLYRFNSRWMQTHAEDFGADERRRILAALDQAVAEEGLGTDRSWGEKIEDRGSQITFSGLGQQAPLDAKQVWDPDLAKRKRLQATLRARLPGFSINIGGSTSIDVTREGVDKAYGMRRLSEESGVPADAILFLGDAVFPGGNDYPVRAAGIDTIAVRDVEESKRVIEAIVACLRDS